MAYALAMLKKDNPDYSFRQLWFPTKPKLEKAVLQQVFTRFVVVGTILFSLTGLLLPAQFVSLAREQPLTWIIASVLYPLLSVYPQEIIYRAFFFQRYRPLVSDPQRLYWLNVGLFGFMHIMYGNIAAVVLSMAGGMFFAKTYLASRSLRLTVIEHALYGEIILFAGLGSYFFYRNQIW
jgi:membrane protease YdiL (CAAX protease family)